MEQGKKTWEAAPPPQPFLKSLKGYLKETLFPDDPFRQLKTNPDTAGSSYLGCSTSFPSSDPRMGAPLYMAATNESKGYRWLGLRSMRQANSAFLTKLGFRLKRRLQFVESILGNIKFLRRGSKIEVGNGKQTLSWYDNWLGKEPLYNVATDPVPRTVAECKVADMWDDNRGWKWEVFVD
ncbi:hypothetical protein Cgig2_004031 [Carnegiea gigantea]|uniref:Uncharacterized protein n=1 Tax=Carnegiea gigantea TaxID=171969 RepID=A0A9Q1KQI3_9CARY|nr:hypothetical protein Cgig2_004031 [Carnegiea gigantea]